MRKIQKPNRIFATVFISGLCVALFAGVGYAREDAVLYSRAVESAKNGSMDFAFMNYRSILKNYPHSEFRKYALFAHGEYYFLMKEYPKSEDLFNRFLYNYPDDAGELFALGYLLKIANETHQEDKVEALEKQIITFRQLGLVFRNFKTYKFRSPLYRSLKTVFYIDKIEFYADKEPFEEISY